MRICSSLLLSEFEAYSLNCAGVLSNSAADFIFSSIFELKNFTVSTFENYTLIQIDGNPNYQLRLNSSSGLMYVLSIINDFTYKGVISNFTGNYCFHDVLTSTLINNLTKYNDIGNNETIMSDEFIQFIEDSSGDLALASAAVMIPYILACIGVIPFLTLLTPIGIVTSLIILGVALKVHANGGNMNKGLGDSIVSLTLNFA